MEIRPATFTIRSKKIGVLIRSARLAAGKSPEDCAQAIGTSSATLETYELGEASPSLPELEALAYFLDTPLEYFWGREVGGASKSENLLKDPIKSFHLRDQIIGVILRKARQDAGLSLRDVVDQFGISEDQLNAFELGEQPIPIPELEALARAVNRPLSDFQESRGPIGCWTREQQALKVFTDLTPELQSFICDPANRPYLELAQRLSEISVEQLRPVAKNLMEITHPNGNSQ